MADNAKVAAFQFLDLLPSAALFIDQEHRCLYSNPAWQTLSESAPAENLGLGWQKIFQTEIAWDELITKKPGEAELEICSGLGEQLILRLKWNPSIEPSGYLIAAENITAEKAQRLENEKPISKDIGFHLLADSLPQMVWLTDAQGRGIYASQKWYNYTGTHLGAATWREVFHPDDIPKMAEHWIHALQTGSLYSTQFRLRSKEGNYRWFLSQGLPVRDAEGRVVQWFGTLTDIDEQKVTQDKLTQSENLFRTIFESAAVGVALGDPWTGRFLQVNEKLAEMSGYSTEELLQLRIWDLAHPDDRGSIQREDSLSDSKIEYQYRKRFLRKNGETFWVQVNATVFNLAEAGQALRSIAIIQDVTREQEASMALAESELRFRRMADSLPQILWSIKPDGQLEYLNKRWYEFVGETEPIIADNSWTDLVHPEDLARWIPLAKEARNNGKPYELEYRLWHRQSESYKWFLARIIPVTDAQGKIKHWIGTATDIEEQKKANEAHHQARLALEASQMKSEFLANMSHEIRTPLHGIIGMTNLLLDTAITKTQKEYLETTRICADGLLDLVNDVLDFAKVEAGKVDPEKLPFDLMSLIQEVQKIMSLPAEKKGLRLSFEGFHQNFHLIGDPKRLRQILINLISNAIKFSNRGVVRIQALQLSDSMDCVKYRFQVQDEGVGISEAHLSKLFQPFYQVDSSTSRKFEGSGLGLSICKRLVDFMHGQIGVQSQPGTGSIFWFELQFPKVAKTNAEPSLHAGEFYADSSSKGRVLAVEDNIVNQKVLQAYLQRLGFAGKVVDSGETAMECLKQSHFDLILMDCQMPGMDGYETTRLIRKIQFEHNSSEIPIIAVTANALPENREKCLQAGMDDFLAKPLVERDLRKCLNRWLIKAKRLERNTIAAATRELARETSLQLSLEVLRQFQNLCPKSFKQMQRALSEGHLQALVEESQSLRTSAEILGAFEMVEVLEQVENSESLDQARDLLNELEKRIEITGKEISNLLPQIASTEKSQQMLQV